MFNWIKVAARSLSQFCWSWFLLVMSYCFHYSAILVQAANGNGAVESWERGCSDASRSRKKGRCQQKIQSCSVCTTVKRGRLVCNELKWDSLLMLCLQINLVLQATGHSAQKNISDRSSSWLIIHYSGCILSQQRCPSTFGCVAVLFCSLLQTMVHASLSAEKCCGAPVGQGTDCVLFTGILKTTDCDLQNGIECC